MKAKVSIVHQHGESIDDITVIDTAEFEIPSSTDTGELGDTLTTELYANVLGALDGKFAQENAKALEQVELKFWVEVEPVLPLPTISFNKFMKKGSEKTVRHLKKDAGATLEEAVSGYFEK